MKYTVYPAVFEKKKKRRRMKRQHKAPLVVDVDAHAVSLKSRHESFLNRHPTALSRPRLEPAERVERKKRERGLS